MSNGSAEIEVEDDDPEATHTYTISVCAGNATLLREFSLETDQITSIDMAESRVRENLQSSKFEAVIAVVTEVTARGLTQIQISVQPRAAATSPSNVKRRPAGRHRPLDG